ncbi:probable receptor-like protein kinase At5g18500 [Phragmites australis]|uniref:probable receptor-like protein kinase At5g18500 n=1 Tax=Phragmites australis TaxID=29695 RepID=UPI002D793F3A|nr:probable receptor-like protein kinase At5g18500 [Phragmites australis]
MADPVSIVKLIISIGKKIKEGVEKAQRNVEDCRRIDELVHTVTAIVESSAQRTPKMMYEPVMSRLMKKLVESLERACKLVKDCNKKNLVLRGLGADDTAEKLRQVHHDIWDNLLAVIFANGVNQNAMLTNTEQMVAMNFANGVNQNAMLANIEQMVAALLVHLPPGREAVDSRTRNSTKDASCSRNENKRKTKTDGASTASGTSEAKGQKNEVPARSDAHAGWQEKDIPKEVSSLTSNLTGDGSSQKKNKGKTRKTDGASTASGTSEAKGQKNKVPAQSEASSASLPPARLTEYSFSLLEVATGNFYEKNRIGEGGSGTVYKGELADKDPVAVKKLLMINTSPEARLNELILVSELEHKNIVKLLGYCDEVKKNSKGEDVRHFIFVSRYMPNESLKKVIKNINNAKQSIDWPSLFRIIQGIAEGVHYLHKQHVVHLDLKPSNVLLDSDMTPKINDFRRAVRLLDNGRDEITLDDVSLPDTEGYVSPEQKERGTGSTKSDVYSFGVLLLETISCMCEKRHRPSCALREEWLNRVQESEWRNIFDPKLVTNKYELTVATRCVVAGLLCCLPYPAERPSMAHVVDLLAGRQEKDTPKEVSSLTSNLTGDGSSHKKNKGKTRETDGASTASGTSEAKGQENKVPAQSEASFASLPPKEVSSLTSNLTGDGSSQKKNKGKARKTDGASTARSEVMGDNKNVCGYDADVDC